MRLLVAALCVSALATGAQADLAPYPPDAADRRLPPEVVDLPTLRWHITRRGHACADIVSAQPYTGAWAQRLAAQRIEGGVVRCVGGEAYFVGLHRQERLLPGGRWRQDVADVTVTRLR